MENVEGSEGKVLYITPNQYTAKANSSLKFCSSTWDLKDINGDIDDNMTLVCGEGAILTDAQQLKIVMENKCSVSYTQFAAHFDESTGVYNTSLDCSHRGMSDTDLMKFNILNEIKGSFSLNDNNLTHLEGLSNLNYIGGYFYLHNNKIQNTSGLSSLSSIGGTFNISGNAISNLDGLVSLASVGGLVKIYHNPQLNNIAGLTNLTGADGKKIYIDSTNYTDKADGTGNFCDSRWDLYDTSGNVADDMSILCNNYSYTPNNTDKLRDILGRHCNIDSLTFYTNFTEATSVYTGSIACTHVLDNEMSNFVGLLEVEGDFAIEDSNITTMDELIRLKKVTGVLSIQKNLNLTNIHGLSNVFGIDGEKLIIDDASQYDVRADETLGFCSTNWDIYTGTINSTDDMSEICGQ